MTHDISFQGSVHQGDPCFNPLSRGRQCALMTLAALLYSETFSVQRWTLDLIDQILFLGDQLFVQALLAGQIPDEPTLQFKDIPTIIRCPRGISWTIRSCHYFQGMFQNTALQIPSFVSLNDALQGAFVLSNNLCLILGGYIMAIKRSANFIVFSDSHSRNRSGMPDAVTGKAVVLIFSSITKLVTHISNLAANLSVNLFEVVPVTLLNSHNNLTQAVFESEQSKEANLAKERHRKPRRELT